VRAEQASSRARSGPEQDYLGGSGHVRRAGDRAQPYVAAGQVDSRSEGEGVKTWLSPQIGGTGGSAEKQRRTIFPKNP
jgi:hypothetical protein